MTSGLLDFFTLEASEYVEQLDGLVAHAPSGAPDLESFARASRALRGSATMAKVRGIADVAQGLERVARAVREGRLPWEAALQGTIVAAIDDLKILIRAVRHWGPAEESRASARIAELAQVAPIVVRATTEGGTDFLVAATSQAGTALLAWSEAPESPEQFADTMHTVRALRGVAALRDLPPLPEVVDAVDAAAKPMELGTETATAERRRLFRTAARVLLESAEALRAGRRPDPESAALVEFAQASAALRSGREDAEEIIPIARLFPDGAGDESIERGPNPPTSATARFRLEIVSQAEHLRRLVADARGAADAATRERLRGELGHAVRTVRRAAESFAAHQVAALFDGAEAGARALEHAALGVLDEAAHLLTDRGVAAEQLGARVQQLADRLRARVEGSPIVPIESLAPDQPSVVHAAPVATAPISVAAAAAPSPAGAAVESAPQGAALSALLATGIAGLDELASSPFASQTRFDDDDVVPIEELLFRGKDALARAVEIGTRLQRAGAPPDGDALAELVDLLQLAAAD